MASSSTDRPGFPRDDRPGRVRRAIRRRTRRLLPAQRASARAAADWAADAAAALPEHTHAAQLVGLVRSPPPGLTAAVSRDVVRAVETSSATCLQRSLVLQAWFVHLGQPCEVVLGVALEGGFRAHAWIPGYSPASESDGYTEIARVPPGGSGHASIRSAIR